MIQGTKLTKKDLKMIIRNIMIKLFAQSIKEISCSLCR